LYFRYVSEINGYQSELHNLEIWNILCE